ncbi:MAG: type II toxin-antitoxin system VapC family toxin [Candidatus Binatia bacterium]
MTFAYFDTSALVKRYVRERGSAQIGSLLRRHDLLSSAITPVEVLSALWRRKRNGDLSEENFSATLSRVQSDRIRWELVEAGGAVLRRAEEIVQGTVGVIKGTGWFLDEKRFLTMKEPEARYSGMGAPGEIRSQTE